jgi:myo-inositol-1(or 4)-monophosphatase
VAGRAGSGEFQNLLRFAHVLADTAGPVVLQHFRRPIDVENKAAAGYFDPVTKADRGAEKAIAKVLRQSYPDHTLIGEEFGTTAGKSPYQWVVDPIDGTRAYIMGSPLWGTLIGLLKDGKPVLGIMDQPFTGERFWSDRQATYMRVRDGKPKRLKTRGTAKLSDAVFATTHPELFGGAKEQRAMEALKGAARMSRFGGDCYNYCLLAAGFVDVIIETGLKNFDIVALIPIIERAGGCVSTWTGAEAADGGSILASANPTLHDAALRLLAKA